MKKGFLAKSISGPTLSTVEYSSVYLRLFISYSITVHLKTAYLGDNADLGFYLH